MTISRIHLWTLLRHFGETPHQRTVKVRKDARAEVKKRERSGGGGPDFYTAFWSDAKRFVAGELDLHEATLERVNSNRVSRTRSYPQLERGFLRWWNENRRWVNEPISPLNEIIKAPHHFVEMDGVVKVENILALRVGDEGRRYIYPYNFERPVLSAEIARLGL